MIVHRMKRHCVVCLAPATRGAHDEFGDHILLCDRCPSPEDIRLRTAEVRASWSEADFNERGSGHIRLDVLGQRPALAGS